MAKAAGTWISPIGEAFRIVREGSSGINLYHTDNKHQSVYGAYLKACVNYLVLYGTAFGSAPATAASRHRRPPTCAASPNRSYWDMKTNT